MEIKSVDGAVLWTGVAASMRDAVELAVKSGANLDGASLMRADLAGAALQGALLRRADLRGADLKFADLQRAKLAGSYFGGANLRCADLASADLAGANLWNALLTGANLQYAYLLRADLTDADLTGAGLRRANIEEAFTYAARGLPCEYPNPLLRLLTRQGPLTAYKIVTPDRRGIYYPCEIKYADGAEIRVEDANTNPQKDCAEGINVATWWWCQRALRALSKYAMIIQVEFTAGDIAAIPHESDGKFRLHRCKVVGEAAAPAE